ncbi:MAG: AbrB/MazE/SpoVT family DNA-binding domain-containing protein [Chloroflexota bacterium]|nr:AbrB/MazE/SpoVT family DNA-binding domain-containing protein [Chloroflexota bacterium]
MQTAVSVRGQTVIPQEIRKAMGIVPQSSLKWQVKENIIIVYPIPIDTIQAALGVFKGRGPTTDDLLTERRQEHLREQKQEAA